jgi:predicted O-methyltransferase YrrM
MNQLKMDRVQLLTHFKEILGNEPVRIVEVGSYEGNYALSILNEFPNANIDLVDLWQTDGNDFYYSLRPGDTENAYQVAKSRFDSIPNVRLIRKSSTEACKDFEDESIDLLYIDADHSYDGMLLDLNLWFPKVKRGRIAAGHDWNCLPQHPEHSKFGVYKALCEFLGDQINDISTTNEDFPEHQSWFLVKK